ncbi:hypothetical protein ACQKWADRAFT_296462 [Trichoderma austrokoningii]
MPRNTVHKDLKSDWFRGLLRYVLSQRKASHSQKTYRPCPSSCQARQVAPTSEGTAPRVSGQRGDAPRGSRFRSLCWPMAIPLLQKGTVRAFVKHLEHEAAVYERLQVVQGINVAVFLDAVDVQSMNKSLHSAFDVPLMGWLQTKPRWKCR